MALARALLCGPGMGGMAVTMVAVVLALGGCAVEPAPGEGCGRDALVDPRAPGPAYTGFRWACARGPGCPDQLACDAAVWRRLDDGALEELSACLLGPCERRRECVEEALIECAITGRAQ